MTLELSALFSFCTDKPQTINQDRNKQFDKSVCCVEIEKKTSFLRIGKSHAVVVTSAADVIVVVMCVGADCVCARTRSIIKRASLLCPSTLQKYRPIYFN